MSEHIIETEVFAGTAFVPVGGTGKLREEIVRCRDCKEYIERKVPHGKLEYNSATCGYFGGDYVEIEPNGFCAWGKRLVTEEI